MRVNARAHALLLWSFVSIVPGSAVTVRAQPLVRPELCGETGATAIAPSHLRVLRACAMGGDTVATTLHPGSGERLGVVVKHLDRYISEYDRSADTQGERDPAKLILFVNGAPIARWYPSLPEPGKYVLYYDLDDLPADSTRRVVRTRLLDNSLRGHKVTLSVGFEGQRPLASEVDDFELRALDPFWLGVWIFTSGAVVGLLVWAARRGNILRVPGPEPSNPQSTAGQQNEPGQARPANAPRKAYSLARTQMAAWFVVVLMAYLLIYLVTGALEPIPTTVLGLMGISAVTGFLAAVADTSTESQALAPAIARGFWTDLVSDSTGMSLPRLQILAWTGVLILIFGKSVYQTLAMPEFDTTLLGLMGISSGTYLGFKKPDQRS